MKQAEPLHYLDPTHVLHQGKELTFFAGCDYFRISRHPRVIGVLRNGVEAHGLTLAASRMTTGNHRVYLDLERALARSFGAEAALIFSSGYISGLAVAQAVAGEYTHAFVDERSHAALYDAAKFLGCPVTTFKHRQPGSLRAVMAPHRTAKTRFIVLTDGLFSHDGFVAPIREYLRLLPRNATLLVDDAHGAGIIGRNGRGALEFAGVGRARVIQCISLSKAFGVFGGAVLCSRKIRDAILAKAHIFVGSTPIPLPIASAANRSLQLLSKHRAFLNRLHGNSSYVKTALRKAGLPIENTPGPIIALPRLTRLETARVRKALLAAGIFPSLIRYLDPGDGYFRFVISSEHTKPQLDALIIALTASTP